MTPLPIRLDNRTHQNLWRAWSVTTLASFAVLEYLAISDAPETGNAEDTLTFTIRGWIRPWWVWFPAAGFWVWQLLHFLLPTVPWTGHGHPIHHHDART